MAFGTVVPFLSVNLYQFGEIAWFNVLPRIFRLIFPVCLIGIRVRSIATAFVTFSSGTKQGTSGVVGLVPPLLTSVALNGLGEGSFVIRCSI